MEDIELVITLLSDLGTVGVLIYVYREERIRARDNVAYYRRLVRALFAGVLVAVGNNPDSEDIHEAATGYAVEEEDLQ